MLLKIHPKNPDKRAIQLVTECLLDGGIIIYPTDTVYGLGCNIYNHEAVEKICKIKNIKPAKAQLSFICSNLTHLSNYTKSIDTPLFRILKQYLPGPYTFILQASKQVPKILQSNRKTIGLRIPNNLIALQIVEALQNPLLSASLPSKNDIYLTDIEEIYGLYKNQVEIVIDGGTGGEQTSTIIDCTEQEIKLIRLGAGKWAD
ncbi:MAG: L-threonylcarbamoyladenylate synthase [Sediminibacterium sp.]|nr:L-threonylcarbamoyladenylate synthase [Sediminibacterium sp.]